MEIQANPDLEQLKSLLLIAGVVLTVMLAIIGFFVGAHFKALNALTETVGALEKAVTALQTQLEIQSPVTQERLNAHSSEIKGLNNRLLVIETDHKTFHGRKRHDASGD